MFSQKKNIYSFLRKALNAALVAAIALTLQSWSRPSSEKGRPNGDMFLNLENVFAGDTVYTAYDRMIDSLADLNLSRDSLKRMGLSEKVLFSLDSIYKADSIASIIVYSPKELKRMRRDSIRNYKDSVIRSLPRILDTYLFEDSVKYQRIFAWRHNTYDNNQNLIKIDTSYNYHFFDFKYMREDAGAQYLGVSGSAALPFNYFKREKEEIFPFIEPYLTYTYLPNTLPFYNTKTPYTELAYTGTFLANRQKSEDNVRVLHTQNFTPSFNFSLLYERFGSNGLLQREKTDFRTLGITGNYLGKRYIAQGGYLFSRLKRNENGGIQDMSMIRDTTVDVRTIAVNLSNASQIMRRNTFFLTHSYGVPIVWKAKRDSLGNKISDADNADKGTVTFFGHYGEYTTYTRSYTDRIDLSDEFGRAFYNNNFFINPTETFDSVRVAKFENRFFIKIQPWSDNAIVSKLEGGIGHQLMSVYGFKPEYFLQGNKSEKFNNLFAYFGAKGKLKNNFEWNALANIDYSGYYKGNTWIDASMKYSNWSIPEGIHLTAKLNSSLKTPSYFFQNYYSNHFVWNNNFDKSGETKLEALLEIPHWGLEAQFGYSLLNKNIYFDETGTPQQKSGSMHVMSGYIAKNFKVGVLHLDNKLLFQSSSDEDILPLPKFAANLKYYLQLVAVKNVLNVQIGANVTFNSKYYAQKYNPALGLFYNQKEEKFGNNPYVDAFINLQWKRACIFLKVENVAEGWPDREFFSTYGYIRPETSFKIGIWWPFYIH